MVTIYYVPAPGQATTAARMAALGAVAYDTWVPKPAGLDPLPAVVLYAQTVNQFVVYHDDGTLLPATLAADPIHATEQINVRAAGAVARNVTFITAAATVTFPLTLAEQQALVTHVVDLSKDVNALIHLALDTINDATGT